MSAHAAAVSQHAVNGQHDVPPPEWNNTRVEYPEVLIHEVIARQASRTPRALALVFEGSSLAYEDLDRRANQLANHLCDSGVRRGVLVGICAERSLDLVVGLLGILKAGGAYVPLDPEYPRQRLLFMLEDTHPRMLLTQERLAAVLPPGDARVVCLDRDWHLIEREPGSDPRAEAKGDDLAYVIYTSGSTGKPKGVMNTHGGIANRLFWMQDRYQMTPADTVLQKTPFSFDVSVWEFFWPLMTGARLVLARPGGHRDSGYLARLIAQERVTVLHFVPSMLQLFLEAPGLEDHCQSLRHVICSGEALSHELQERFFGRLGAELHNLYGPTEAAVDVTYWTCQRGSQERVVPIGRPVANTQIYVLDEQLRQVPVGAPGELYIGGVQVARGYLNRPELTAERFIPDPFIAAPGARLYRTGDLARYRPDGAVEFLGRVDHQVKINGIRVELGEIEAALEAHGTVRQAVAVARQDAGGTRFVAYLVPAANALPDGVELRRYLSAELPEYMVPSRFVVLDRMPLTPSGKVDRNALPEPEVARPASTQAYVAPRDDLERLLATIWCEILGVERVGMHDKFFELGGTSLQAARLVNRVQQELGEFVYVVTIFDAPSVAEYAAMLWRDYGAAVSRRLGVQAATSAPAVDRRAGVARIDAAAIERMRESIPVLPRGAGDDEPDSERNAPALFILSPPRSGTTLLRVMLAGHPALFAAAELQLLGFHTMPERRRAFSGKYSVWLEGALRALMEIKQCDADEAKRLMEDYEGRGWTTKQFYGALQEWIAPMMLVDKSPAYVLDLATLQKAERDFDRALYIHLVRHPYAMIRSFESYHMDQVLYLRDHLFTARELGELVWAISQQNTLRFLDGVPPERQFRIRFEDLVTQPRDVMQAMCSTLRLEFHEDLVQPYKGIEKKMTDGLYADSTPMGDTKLLEHGRIEPAVAETWRGVATDDFLGDVTWDLAASLGYGRPTSERATRDVQRDLRERRRAHRGRI